jgi:hypothetical protein
MASWICREKRGLEKAGILGFSLKTNEIKA